MEKAFTKPYENGWDAKPASNSWVTPEIMDNYDNAIDEIDNRVIGQSEDLTQNKNSGFLQSNNLFNKDLAIKGKYANASSKAIVDNVDYWVTDYIKVQGTNVVVSGYTMGYVGGSVGMVAYDSNKNPISSSNRATMDISNATYIVCSVSNNNINTFQVEYGTSATPYTPYAPSNIELKENLTQLSTIESNLYSALLTHVQAWKQNKVVTVGTIGSFPFVKVNCSANTYTTIAILDEKYRPKNAVNFVVNTFNPNQSMFGQVNTNGEVKIYPLVALTENSSQVFFNVSYSI